MKVGPFPQTTPDETETVDLTSDVAVGLPDLFAKKATLNAGVLGSNGSIGKWAVYIFVNMDDEIVWGDGTSLPAHHFDTS